MPHDPVPAASAAGADLRQQRLAEHGAPAAQGLAAANTVTVMPGGKTFPTIGAALDSIADSSQSHQYTIYVGPGTYAEIVTLKPFVALVGGGQGTDDAPGPTITSPPRSGQDWAVVTGAPDSGVIGCRIASTGGSWGDFAVAVRAKACGNFSVQSCLLEVGDGGGNGLNLVAAMIDLNSGRSSVLFSDCRIAATAGGTNSVATGLQAWPNAKVQVTESTVTASGGLQSFGAIFSRETTALVSYGTVTGGSWSIYLPDGTGDVTAVGCTLNGPVSDGVHVKPD